jgi:Family of unknown function (DUF5313)
MERVRPNPVRWLWYAVGGRLPEKYQAWVLNDVTGRTWLWRHAARASVMLAPLILVWLLLPGPLLLRVALCVMAALVGYFYSLVYAEESGNSRLVKNGFPPGTAKRVRAEAREAADAPARERYLAMYRHE